MGEGDYLILVLMTYQLNPAKRQRWSQTMTMDFFFLFFKDSVPAQIAYLERDHASCYLVSLPKKVSFGKI